MLGGRRRFFKQLGAGVVLFSGRSSATLAARLEQESRQSPRIHQPILFNTPEADRVLEGLQIFPADNAWNQEISRWPVHLNSKRIIASIGEDKPLRHNTDMGFVLVPPNQKRVPARLTEYPDESDRGPFPIPDDVPIEGWPANYQRDPKLRSQTLDSVQRDALKLDGDRHAIVVDPENGMLYEFYGMFKTNAGWQARQSSVFNLKSNRLRPDGWTSTDAAGLPLFPAIVRYDELERGKISHAMRFTVRRSRRAYVYPATHFASRLQDPNLPRMGERLRLRSDFDLAGFSPNARTLLQALKTYGMLVADNGLDWAISVAPDERIPAMHDELRRVKGSAFEVVQKPM
jgi:hypothetical protein